MPQDGSRGAWIWSKFAEAVNVEINKVCSRKDSTKKISLFTKIMNDAADEHVGKTKSWKQSKPWITPPVRALIKQRNRMSNKKKRMDGYLQRSEGGNKEG